MVRVHRHSGPPLEFLDGEAFSVSDGVYFILRKFPVDERSDIIGAVSIASVVAVESIRPADALVIAPVGDNVVPFEKPPKKPETN